MLACGQIVKSLFECTAAQGPALRIVRNSQNNARDVHSPARTRCGAARAFSSDAQCQTCGVYDAMDVAVHRRMRRPLTSVADAFPEPVSCEK